MRNSYIADMSSLETPIEDILEEISNKQDTERILETLTGRQRSLVEFFLDGKSSEEMAYFYGLTLPYMRTLWRQTRHRVREIYSSIE